MEEIKSMINKIGKNITKTSKDIIKNTKLSMQLSSEEEKLKNLYIEIGKKVYEIYSYGGNIGDFFEEKYKQMVQVEKEIAIIKEKMAENKNMNNTNDNIQVSTVEECRICQSCGHKNGLNDRFCLKCGRFL